jgi:hypothetical protein
MYNFKHYLNFLDLPQIGTIQISEPFGFDGSSFKVEQDSKRFGRDVFKANEEIELEFTREQFERLNTPQTLPDGTQINHASQGWDYLIQLFELYGWESSVEYILEKDDVTFTQGIFDYFTAVISNDSIKFKIIQDSAREKLKRNADTFVDAFNDKDLDGNAITPCATTNILLKAKPIVQNSVWEQNESINKVAGENTGTFLPSRSLTSFEIENSYIPFNENSSGSSGGGVAIAIKNFTIIEAKSLLVGITAKMKTDILFHYEQSGGSSSSFASLQLQYALWQGDNPTIPYGVVTVYEKKITGTATQDFLIDQDINFNLPSLNIGQKLAIYWRFIYDTEHISRTEWDFNDTELSITAISQGIDSVIKGVRLIDLIKHNIKSASGLNTIAPLYDVGGIYYDTFAFNGYLIGQITDKEFNNKFKDLMDILPETFQDYQINTNEVEILPSYDYYANNEIGAFIELPDHESTTTFNKRYFLNTADIGFKNSSKNRETNGQNTIDDVHGTTQWKYPNTKADGNLKLELDHIRSAFLIEEARRLATNTDKTTSLQNDSKLFLLDVVSLSPSAKGGFGAVLLMNELDNGHLQILNNNTDGTLGNFNWGLLGFGVGAQFFIDSGENVGTWQVWSITDSILELFPMTVSASFTGEAFIEVSYFLTDVAFVNRTNEGFSVVEGVENPTNYSNLLSSVKRIMQRWYPYFATATKYVQDKLITNTSFEPNGNLVTRFIGESANVVDNADISTTAISSQKVLNPVIHDITVYCDYSEAIDLVDKVVTDKGFIRVMLNSGKVVKGYPQMLDYEWTTAKLNVKLEEKFESDFMTITESEVVIYINEVGYSQKTGLSNFELNSDFVVFYDANDIRLNNPIHYTKVSVNGTTYTDVIDFSDAIQNLIE